MCLSTRRLKKKKKQRVNLEPRRPMAARLKKQKVDYEPHRPTAARLITSCKLRPLKRVWGEELT